MKRCLVSACAALLLVAGSAAAQQKATIAGVPDIPFTSVQNFLKLPAGEYLGESVAVATDCSPPLSARGWSRPSTTTRCSPPTYSSRSAAPTS